MNFKKNNVERRKKKYKFVKFRGEEIILIGVRQMGIYKIDEKVEKKNLLLVG